MTQQQKKLIIQNHNLIYSFCSYKNLNVNDVYDILAESLVKAATIYDGRNKFSTLAYTIMQNDLIRYFQKEKKHKNNISLDYLVGEDESIPIGHMISDKKSEFVEAIEISDCLNRITTDRDKKIIELYMNGNNLKEIGEIVHLTKSRVQQIVKEIKYRIEMELWRE